MSFPQDTETSGITAEPIDGDMRHLHGTLKGPVGTAYEGGVFEVDIHIPDTYPFEPPKVQDRVVLANDGRGCLVTDRPRVVVRPRTPQSR